MTHQEIRQCLSEVGTDEEYVPEVICTGEMNLKNWITCVHTFLNGLDGDGGMPDGHLYGATTTFYSAKKQSKNFILLNGGCGEEEYFDYMGTALSNDVTMYEKLAKVAAKTYRLDTYATYCTILLYKRFLLKVVYAAQSEYVGRVDVWDDSVLF